MDIDPTPDTIFNTTVTTEPPDGALSDDASMIIWVVGFFILIPSMILAFLGNAWVFTAYARDPKVRKNTTNVYILNLAIADFIVGIVMLINLPCYIKQKWLYGKYFCIFVWALDFIWTDVSVITIMAISLDRYRFVKNTLSHRAKQSRKTIAVAFAMVWLIIGAAHLTLAFCYSTSTNYQYFHKQECNLEYRRNKPLGITLAAIEFIGPAICICILNVKAFVHLRRRGSRIKLRRFDSNGAKLPQGRTSDLSIDTTIVSGRGSHVSDDAEMRMHCAYTKIARRERHNRAAQLLSLLLITFLLTWLPYFVYDCYIIFSGTHPDEDVSSLLTIILWSNSAINPFLYACNNIHFRRKF